MPDHMRMTHARAVISNHACCRSKPPALCAPTNDRSGVRTNNSPPDTLAALPNAPAAAHKLARRHNTFTPPQFFKTVSALASRRGRPVGDLAALASDLGLDAAVVLHQKWSSLSVSLLGLLLLAPWHVLVPPRSTLTLGTHVSLHSDIQGGQAQRVSLAIAVALKPAVLLLDEPTSALDADSARRAEAVLSKCGAALVWVTHDDAQPARVGGRQLALPGGEVTWAGDTGGGASDAAAAAAAAAARLPEQVEVAIGG